MAFLLTGTGNARDVGASALPTGNPAFYLGDVDCVQPGDQHAASAVGAGGTGRSELVSSGRPRRAPGRTKQPTSLTGLSTTGIPTEINNANLQPNPYQTFITAGWRACLTTPFPALYPFHQWLQRSTPVTARPSSSPGLNVAVGLPPSREARVDEHGAPRVSCPFEVFHSSGNCDRAPVRRHPFPHLDHARLSLRDRHLHTAAPPPQPTASAAPKSPTAPTRSPSRPPAARRP